METINEEITSTVTRYKAYDGKVFDDRYECEAYEKSAKCALIAMLNNMVVKEVAETDIFPNGSEETSILIVKLSGKEDIETVLKLIKLTWDTSPYYLERTAERLDKALVLSQYAAVWTDGVSYGFYGYEEEYISRIHEAFKITEECDS